MTTDTAPSVIYDSGAQVRRRIARNTAAEVRGLDESRNCRWNPTRKVFEVKSSDGSRDYDVTVSALNDLLVMGCTPCPSSKRPSTPGLAGCKHRALTARRLARTGAVYFGDDGLWHVSPALLADALAREGS